MYNFDIDCINLNCNCQFRSVANKNSCNYLHDSHNILLESINIQKKDNKSNPNPTRWSNEVGPIQLKLFSLMLNILQSNKLALLNLNHNLLSIQFIAKYKLKQCNGFIGD